MEKLHLGARWTFRFRAYWSLIFVVVFLSIYSMGVVSSFVTDALSTFLWTIIIGLFIIILVGEIYARMAYNRWLYEFTKTELRLERGIIWKKYSNIPYERIQNVDITRGILARMLGFSTLNIQTAGYSGGYQRGGIGSGMSEGHIPAVSKEAAEKIREFVMHKISGKKSGL